MEAKHRLILLLAILFFVSISSASPVSAATWDYVNYTEDFVDAQTNIRAPTDIGTHTDWTELQDKDGTFDTLTEADTGGAGGTEEYIAESCTETVATFTDVANSYDGDWASSMYETTAVTTDYWPVAYWTGFDSANAGSGAITQVDIIIRLSVSGTSNDEWGLILANLGSDTTLRAEATGDQALTNLTYTDVSEPNDASWSWADVWSCQVDLDYDKVANSDNFAIYIYEMCVKVTTSGASNYDLDLEVGWTTADYDETVEYLCIFGGTQGAEALRVDIWTGAWTNLDTDVEAGWNNYSISSYLTDATVEIRFTDTTGDAVEADTWQVEGVLLRTHSYAYTETFFEELGLSDTEYISRGVSKALYDAVGAADTEYLSAGRSQTLFESIGLADTIYTVFDAARTFYESVGMADTVYPAASFIVILFEAIGIASTILASKMIQKFFFESIGAADTIATILTASKTLYDSIGISDTKHLTADLTLTLFESVGIAGIIVASAQKAKTMFESVGLADAVTATLIPGGNDYQKFLFESVGVADSHLAVIPTVKKLFESIGIADVVEAIITIGAEEGGPGYLPKPTTREIVFPIPVWALPVIVLIGVIFLGGCYIVDKVQENKEEEFRIAIEGVGGYFAKLKKRLVKLYNDTIKFLEELFE